MPTLVDIMDEVKTLASEINGRIDLIDSAHRSVAAWSCCQPQGEEPRAQGVYQGHA